MVDPYLEDRQAQRVLGAAETAARRLRLDARYVYVPGPVQPGVLDWIREALGAGTVIGMDARARGA